MTSSYEIRPVDNALGLIYVNDRSPIKVFGTEKIRSTFDAKTIEQAVFSRSAPGVSGVVLTPDAHAGYGAPIGCVMASQSYIYPGPVGNDINCSMSLLQLQLPDEALQGDKSLRRAIIKAIEQRIPTGYSQAEAPKSRNFPIGLLEMAVVMGATPDVCEELQIPLEWLDRCEDVVRTGHDGTVDSIGARWEFLKYNNSKQGVKNRLEAKLQQLGSYGGGNHFGECEVVRLTEAEKSCLSSSVADVFGLIDGNVAFLSHCGSRGFGSLLAQSQFALLRKKFEQWGIPFPGNDPELVYAPLGTEEADNYIDDMTLGANFATLNHLVINSLVLEAFQEVIPGVKGNLVYLIAHNNARREELNGVQYWIHRKGATRAYPANHHTLQDTPFASTGHPILLPGNPLQGSSVMVALEGARASCYSVNHGAGRALGRNEAIRTLDQKKVDDMFDKADILTNCRQYPLDEAPTAYKDFNEVLRSVELAGLAREVARLQALFVIKDNETSKFKRA